MVSPTRVKGRIVGGVPPITKKKKPEVELPKERIIPPLEPPEELEYATPLQVDILRRAIEEGTLAQKGVTRPLHLTPTQVAEIGFELPEGYLARLEVKAEGAEPMISLITPEGISEPFALPTKLPPEVEIPEITEGDVEALLEQIRIEGRTPEVEGLMMEFGATEEEIESFFAELIAPEVPKARPEDIQRILRMGGVPEDEIRKVQELATLDLDSEGWLKKFVEINPSTKKSFAYALFSRSFAAGLGDIIAAGGGVAGWAKQEDMRLNLLELAGTLQSSAPPQEVWEPSMATILDPRFWQTMVARALPFSLSFVPLAVIAAYGGAATAGVVGLGTWGTYILTVIFGGVGAAISEATLEAGGTYNEAKARNFTDEQASEAAGSVFQKNILSLTGMNAAQFFVAFLPAPARTLSSLITRGLVRTATVAGRMTVVGLSEAGEEVIQDIWQRQALGEEIAWDDEMKMVAMLGAIMGVGLGGAGEAFTTIQRRTVDALPEDLKTQYDADITAFELEGLTPEQAQLKALDAIAETEEGKATIDEIIDQIEREETIGLIKPETEAEALAWEHISKQEEVIPEAIPPVEEVLAVPEVVEALPPVKPPVPPVVEVAPAPEGAPQRVLKRIQIEAPEVGLREKIRQGWHKFNIKMVDDLDPLRRTVEEVKRGGVELSIEENPYLLARLLRGVTSKATTFLEYGTFGKKFWKVEKGKAVPNYTGESLESILKQVREPAQWRDFSTYLVARRSVELAKRNIETGIEEADASATITELEAKYKDFPALAKGVYKYQDNLLVYANEMGLISKELLGKLRKYGNYVPFYRVFNELQTKGLMGKKMANIAQPIKRIKGSEREIINPLESIVKNTYVLISAADRNQVGIMLANLVDKNPYLADVFERVKTPMARVARVGAKELGVEVEGMTGVEEEQLVDIFRPSFFVRGDEVTVLIDGKKQFFKVDGELRDALLNLSREELGMLGKVLGAPARWLRLGATLSPDFMARNPARDQMTAFCYSNYGFIPGIDFLRGLAGVLRKDSDYQLYKMSGAEHSMMVSMDRQYLQWTFREIVEGRKFTNYVKHPLELFRILSELGEKATRMGEMKRGIARGAVPLEVGYSTRAVSLDFAQMGTTARAVNSMIAFFNANIRGWGRMVSSFKEHPIRTSAKVFGGITLPSILLYLANRDDPRWKEIPQWQKDIFWIVFVGDRIYRIPKPFELGIIFGSVPERFLEYLDNKDPKLLKDVLINLAEAGNPGWIPTAGLPILEWITNYSFFRGTKVVPASRERMPPELQYTAWTSEVSRKLGELLKLPPAKIDNVIYGWTGGLGRYAMDTLGWILKGTGVSPDIPMPSPTLADIPVVKAFVVRNPYGSSGETVNRFYETLEEYERGERYLKEMLALDEEEKFETFKAAHPELLFFLDFENQVSYSASARYLRRVARDLTEIRKKQDLIWKSKTITPEEKRRLIDKMDVLKTEVARRALNLFLGEEPVVLQFRLSESENRLGEVIEDVPLLSRDKPDIFDMRKLSADYTSELEAIKWEDIKDKKGIPKTVKAWYEKEGSESIQLSFPNTQIYKINADPTKGSTFEDYYLQWQERQLITDSEMLTEHKKKYPRAHLGNFTKRQLEVLRKYHKVSELEQARLLEKYPELLGNPRTNWLGDNPKDNARLALWGQAKILTLEAYREVQRLIKELDIPTDAIPAFTLPPEGSMETHFDYLEKGEEFGWSSWEAQLIKAKDHGYCEWADIDIPDTPIASLELKVKHRKYFDAISSYGDEDSPQYIVDEDLRKQAIEDTRRTKVDGEIEFRDIERQVEAIENGAEGIPSASAIELMRLAKQEHLDLLPGGKDYETMHIMPSPEELPSHIERQTAWAKDYDRVLRALVELGKPSPNQKIIDDGIKMLDEHLALDEKTVQEHKDYAKQIGKPESDFPLIDYLEQRNREKHQVRNLLTGKVSIIEQWIERGRLIDEFTAGSSQAKVWLTDNPRVHQWALDNGLLTDDGSDWNVPVLRINAQWYKEDDAYEVIETTEDGEVYLIEHKKYATERRRRDALGIEGFPEKYSDPKAKTNPMDDYVDWYMKAELKKPEDWPEDLAFYEDDWWLQEHRDFYLIATKGDEKKGFLGLLGWERRDWIKVPTREVFGFYLKYRALLPGKRRDDYRYRLWVKRTTLSFLEWRKRGLSTYEDFEDWLLLTGKVTVHIKEKKIREELTPTERWREESWKREQEIEEKLAEIEEKLKR